MPHTSGSNAKRRIFSPEINLYSLKANSKLHKRFTEPSDIIHFDSDSGISNLMFYSPTERAPYISRFAEVMDTTVAIAIGGAWRETGTATASFAIHFGAPSPFNTNGQLPIDLPQTKQSTELYAARMALETFHDKFLSSSQLKQLNHVVIITDSPYITDGLSRDIWKWETNGYQTAKKTPVANSDLLKGVHGQIKTLEEKQIKVEFWLVEKQYNMLANHLAKQVLDEEADTIQEDKKKPRRRKKKSTSGSRGTGKKPAKCIETDGVVAG